jgi:hypothetical protein
MSITPKFFHTFPQPNKRRYNFCLSSIIIILQITLCYLGLWDHQIQKDGGNVKAIDKWLG